jgi:rare lipoprotein A
MARRRPIRILLALLASASLGACATSHPRLAGPGGKASGAGGYKVGAPYQVGGIWYVPREQPNYDERGVASWYGDAFNMKPTANGEIFDMHAVSGAHTTLPLPSIVEVTNLDNGRKIQVRVNDRGPFVGGRVIDLSHEAARQLGYDRKGLANVRVRYVGPASLVPASAGQRYAAATVTQAPQPTTSYSPAAYSSASVPAETYTPPPQASVSSTTLAPIGAAPSRPSLYDAQPAYAAPKPPAPTTYASASTNGLYRIQAGSFSDQANAARAVSQLSAAGRATIEPIQRDGSTLYRVMLSSGSDEGEAWALRDRVASYGYAEARVIQPF